MNGSQYKEALRKSRIRSGAKGRNEKARKRERKRNEKGKACFCRMSG